MDATLTQLPIAKTDSSSGAPRAHRPSRGKKSKKKVRCEDCFFFQKELCALERKEPCPTFREAHPDGLRPPRQLTFSFRAGRSAAPMAPSPFGR